MVHHGACSSSTRINFLYSPKCACTSIRQLWYACHPEDMIHPTPVYYWHTIPLDYPKPNKELPILLAVRDPFKRAVSMYNHRVCMASVHLDYFYIYAQICAYHNKMEISFLDFCIYLKHSKDNQWLGVDYHFLPQTYIPDEYKDIVSIDDFTNGKLDLIRCEKELYSQIKQFYHKYLPEDTYKLIESRIDKFIEQPLFSNTMERGKFEDLPTDCTNINMFGWTVFPSYDRFWNPEVQAILEYVYADDYQLLGYPTSQNIPSKISSKISSKLD